MPLDLESAIVVCSSGRLKGLLIEVGLQAKVALCNIGNRLRLLIKQVTSSTVVLAPQHH